MINLNQLSIIFIITISNCNSNAVFNISNTSLNTNIKEYESKLAQYELSIKNKNISKQQLLLGEVIVSVKKLFNIPKPNVLKRITDSINNCCEYIRLYLEKNDKTINTDKLKQLHVLSKFLKIGIKLLNEFARVKDERYLYNLILSCPDMIPCLAKEFNVIINVGNLLRRDYKNVKGVINVLDQFVKLSDENTYLLSTIFTVALETDMSFEQILRSRDVSDKKLCKYLDWQTS